MRRRRPLRADLETSFELLLDIAVVREQPEVAEFIERCLARDDQRGLLTCTFAINYMLRILREAAQRSTIATHDTPPIGPQGTPS